MEAALLADFACVLHVCAATLLPLPASLPFSETWTTATPPEQATLGRLDDVYIKEQMEAGMRWTKQSGFNSNQTRDFEMLLDLIKPIMIKQGDIQGAHEIAEGSFGTIYRATYNTRPVAVKRINKDRSKSLAIKMREAYLELNIMNNLSHPNVVQLIGVSAQFNNDRPENFYFGIVLELCSDSLQKCLQKKRWAFADRMRMAIELVHGVSYMHSMGVFHRDLSSQNILVTADAHIKIADFGCARKINAQGEYKTTSITGSPAYMAPEQLEGLVLTLKTDIYAVGVNLWELATQKLPWAEEAMRESPNRLADYAYCRRKVRNSKMAKPPRGMINDSVADAYYEIIMSCHRTDPNMRPTSEELLNKLVLVLSTSSDPKLKLTIDLTKEMQSFLAAPDGVMSDWGQPANEVEETCDSLKRKLFKFYRMYNPDRMYDVPKLSNDYCQKVPQLNASLLKRYGCDLNNYPLRTPSPWKDNTRVSKGRFKSPYSNKQLVRSLSADAQREDATIQARKVSAIPHPDQGGSVETFGGRECSQMMQNEILQKWDATSHNPLAQAWQNSGYMPQEYENVQPSCSSNETGQRMVENQCESQPDRTKTIMTLMSTIKLLENKNAELLQQRQDLTVKFNGELQKVRLPLSALSCANVSSSASVALLVTFWNQN